MLDAPICELDTTLTVELLGRRDVAVVTGSVVLFASELDNIVLDITPVEGIGLCDDVTGLEDDV